MAKIDELIKQSFEEHGPPGDAVAAKLAKMGLRAVPSIVEALRGSSPQQDVRNLLRALTNMDPAGLTPLLIDVINDSNTELVGAAFDVLAQSDDPRALAAMQESLANPDNNETRKSMAAAALGEARNPAATGVLRRAVGDAEDQKEFWLALSAIIALAKLGDHSKAELAIRLATTTKDVTLRPQAAEALTYLVAPGMFAALQKIRRDRQVEVRLHAIDAMFYLGAPESIVELIAMIKDKNATVSTMALARLNDLCGDETEEFTSQRDFQKWWDTNSARFESGVCHRLGAPLWLPDIIMLLQEPNMRERTVPELKMICGRNFRSGSLVPIRSQDKVLARAQAWWGQEGVRRFKRGRLYKYGVEQDLTDAF